MPSWRLPERDGGAGGDLVYPYSYSQSLFPEGIGRDDSLGTYTGCQTLSRCMSAEQENPISGADRVIALAITPLVVGWDLFKNLVFRFFELLERLDPFSAAWRLLKRFVPWVNRLWRAVLPTLVRLRDVLGRVVTRIGALLAPLTKRLAPVVDATWRMLARIARPIYSALRATAREVRRVSEPALRTAVRLWRIAAAPFKRVSASIRHRVELVRVRIGTATSRRGEQR